MDRIWASTSSKLMNFLAAGAAEDCIGIWWVCSGAETAVPQREASGASDGIW